MSRPFYKSRGFEFLLGLVSFFVGIAELYFYAAIFKSEFIDQALMQVYTPMEVTFLGMILGIAGVIGGGGLILKPHKIYRIVALSSIVGTILFVLAQIGKYL